MLFIKYVSDKYGDSDDFAPPVTIPKGASFKDMVALKGDSHIGDKINTQVIQPLIDAKSELEMAFNTTRSKSLSIQSLEAIFGRSQ
jgi:type I restriction enzyme M protein